MINKALRVRIYPNKKQQKKIDATINCCRFVRNHMIERNRKLYNRRKEHLNYNAMQNLLPGMKKYLPWLAEADSQALKYACRQVDNAYQRFLENWVVTQNSVANETTCKIIQQQMQSLFIIK